MTGLLYFRNDVEIIDENEKRIVYTVSADPYEILRENHITLGTYDRIDFTGFEENVATATLTIERAFDVDILEGGKKTATAHSVDATVAQLLEQAGVELGEYDKVSPAKTAVLEEGQKIVVLYTDGVSEAMNAKRELFGEERLEKVLIADVFPSTKDAALAVTAAVAAHRGDVEQSDDITMLVFRRTQSIEETAQ